MALPTENVVGGTTTRPGFTIPTAGG
jgi:hypothetical protein